MPSRDARPSVGGMDKHVLRIGAIAAGLGVVAQVATALLEPARVGEADDALRKIAAYDASTLGWLVHLAGAFLIITALAVVAHTFSEGSGKDWARVGQPLLVIAGALGAAEVLVGASTKDLADGWSHAAPGARLPYSTAFEATWNATVYLDFGAIVAVGLYQLVLAAAILSSALYPRWSGWASAVGGVVGLVGIVLELWSPVGTALDAVGALLLLVVLAALGVSLWRRAGRFAPGDRRVPAAPRLKGQMP